jgi:hypothetical protein
LLLLLAGLQHSCGQGEQLGAGVQVPVIPRSE